MEIKETIGGGATLWARQTIESDIFYWKPDKWFKIWFYLVNKVNHKDNKLFDRGSNFITYKEISLSTKATIAQIDSFIRWAKSEKMIETKKTTRGMVLKVLNYSLYQTIDTYNYRVKPNAEVECDKNISRAPKKTDTETETETPKKDNKNKAKTKKDKIKTETPHGTKTKHNRNTNDTINKNDKNDKNDKEYMQAKPADNEASPDVLTAKNLESQQLSGGINEIIDLFYNSINPNINYGNSTTRKSAEFLIKKYGLENLKVAVNYAISIQGKQYAPTITTPYQLKEKMSSLVIYKQKEQGLKNGKTKTMVGLDD